MAAAVRVAVVFPLWPRALSKSPIFKESRLAASALPLRFSGVSEARNHFSVHRWMKGKSCREWWTYRVIETIQCHGVQHLMGQGGNLRRQTWAHFRGSFFWKSSFQP